MQAYANSVSTWERLKIRVVGEEMYVSPAEIIKTVSENGIARNTNAYKTLLNLNTKYASRLSAAAEEQGTVVALFEGVGNNTSANKRLNANVKIIVDRTYAYSYLSSVGYSDAAINGSGTPLT
jgi:hypothetical protein